MGPPFCVNAYVTKFIFCFLKTFYNYGTCAINTDFLVCVIIVYDICCNGQDMTTFSNFGILRNCETFLLFFVACLFKSLRTDLKLLAENVPVYLLDLEIQLRERTLQKK